MTSRVLAPGTHVQLECAAGLLSQSSTINFLMRDTLVHLTTQPSAALVPCASDGSVVLLPVRVRMRITSKGQVTIPQDIRNRFGFLPETEVEFRVDGNAVRLVKITAKQGPGRGRAAVDRLRGTADIKMSTDEILALTRK